jgi:hypothetical protein
MVRHRMGFFTIAISTAVAWGAVSVSAQTDPIGAIDNIAPEAPTNIAAVPDLGVPNVTVSWDLSPSDAAGVTSTEGGSGNIVPSNEVLSYIIRVSDSGAEAVELARVVPGQTTYTDFTVVQGATYEYLVSATDGTNESEVVTSFPVSIGEPPSISLAPEDPFGFGSVAAAGSISETLTLFNGGPGILSVGFLQLGSIPGFVASVDAGLATLIGPTDRFEIGPGQEREFFVGFDAIIAGDLNGEYDGTLLIITNDPLHRQLEVELTATITGGTAVPSIDVPNTLAFGAVSVGSPSPKSLLITNLGGVTLNADVAISGDPVFGLGATSSLVIEPEQSGEVEIIFSPDDNVFYNGIITITSDDPLRPSVNVAIKGLGKVQGEGPKVVSKKRHKGRAIFPISLDFADLTAVAQCAVNATANIQASLGAGFLVINVTCTEGSTNVDFEIVDDPDAEAPVLTLEESLADLITDIEDPAVEVFPDLVSDLGAVDSVVDQTETVSLQPTDAEGGDIVGWFSRSGSRVDLDDFFLFADAFGRTVESVEDDVFDIAGPSNGPADGLVNFNDFFRFADDFGKTVANAAAIQDLLAP